LNADGKCVDCDDQEYVACQECEITGDSVTCTQAAVNHRLDPETNDVILCDDDGLCNSCTEQECVECSDGTRLSDGKCTPCTDTLPHCDRCSSANNCEMCNSNIASLENGRCTSCQYGWT
jgi:hypothetical protein